MMHRRVTMKDLAHETGLTVATVSRALSGKDKINAKTRERVREAAQRLQYQPDPALARLAAWRWGGEPKTRAGTVLAYLSDSLPLADYMRHRVQGTRRRASELGYSLESFALSELDGNVRRLADVLHARGIEGVVVERICHPRSFDGFPWEDFSAISCGLGEEQLPIPTVTNDTFAAVRMNWGQARARGYRRIGLVLSFGGSQPDPYFRMLGAAKLEQFQAGKEEFEIPPLILLGSQANRDTLSLLLNWLAEHQPDVVIGNVFIFECLGKAGIHCPSDLAFACFALRHDSLSFISGSRVYLQAVGALAVDLCHLELQHPNRHQQPSVLHFVEPEWREGETLPLL